MVGPDGAALRLRIAQPHVVPEIDRLGDLGQGLRLHQGAVAARQVALALVREAAQQQVGHGKRQHAVAEEFEPFVAVREGGLEVGLAVQRAAVGQRLGEELGRAKVPTRAVASLSGLP